MAEPTRVLIADDQDDIRSAFRVIIDGEPDMTVVGLAEDGRSAVEQARLLRPDVTLVDIRMPMLNGLEVTRVLADPALPAPLRVVVVTTYDLDEYVRTALRVGACGFLLKRSSPRLLVEAVRAAASGDTLISPEVTVRLLSELTRSPAPASDTAALTEREIEVCRLVARGLTNAEIAARLFISEGTAKNHVGNIQRKLRTRNRVGIASYAWDCGYVGSDPPR